jgi:probable phosphoglycerate mutase
LCKLILVRHAESTWNLTGRYQGRIDTELSELGQRQASLIAERLKSFPISAIYSSPLRRALHVAIIIALAQGLDVNIEEELTEIDHGAWNGLLRSEVEKRYGPLLQQWLASPSKVKMPGGESLEDVAQRANRVVSQILKTHPEGTVVICSHNAVLKVIIATAIGIELDRFWAMGIDNGSMSVIEFDERYPRLSLLNDVCHLGAYISVPEELAL